MYISELVWTRATVGSAYIASGNGGAGGVAAKFSGVQLRNLAAATKRLAVVGIAVSSDGPPVVMADLTAAIAGIGNGTIQSVLAGTGATGLANARCDYGSDAAQTKDAGTALIVPYCIQPSFAGAFGSPLFLPVPKILPPGSGIAIYNNVVNKNLDVTFYFVQLPN